MGYSPWGRKESDTTKQLYLLSYRDVSIKSVNANETLSQYLRWCIY